MSETSCWIGLFSKFVNFHLKVVIARKSPARTTLFKGVSFHWWNDRKRARKSQPHACADVLQLCPRRADISRLLDARGKRSIRWVGMISTKRNELFMNAFYLVPTFHSLWGWDMFLNFSETFPTEALVSCSQNYPWQVRIGHGTKSKCTARGRRNISWETTSRPSAYRKATLRRIIVIPTAFGTGAAVFQTGFRKIADIRQQKSKNAIWNCQSEIQTIVERWVVASELG